MAGPCPARYHGVAHRGRREGTRAIAIGAEDRMERVTGVDSDREGTLGAAGSAPAAPGDHEDAGLGD